LATNRERAEVEIARDVGETDLDALIAAARQQIDSKRHGQFGLFRIGDTVAHRDVHAAVFDARYLWLGI
jgi:N-methyl-L-proline demethylase